MIDVKVYISDEGLVTSFRMSGHADYGEYGKDLVCAGASAVVFGSVNAILNMAEAEPEIDMDEDDGLFNFTAASPDDDKLQTILETMIISLKTIEEEYGEHIKIHYL